MTDQEWQTTNNLLALLNGFPPVVEIVDAYYKKWNNPAPALNLAEAMRDVEKLLTESRKVRLSEEVKVRLPHEFDSSQTCNYCGMAKETAARSPAQFCCRRSEGGGILTPKKSED